MELLVKFLSGVWGFARGYLNQDELTSERFIANPYGKKPSGRLYRTGDLGRFLKDGTIQFVGRSDYQVKIRGYRIELGEIEAVLQNEPSVKDAAVIVRDDITGEKQIVGYYVSVPDGTMSQEQMKTILKRQLPNHMIPSHLINLDVMPLTSNGKLDRKALAEIPVRRMETERGYEQPRTTNEILLKQIWEQVLGVEDIGTHDNFFELGGDSILSIQIVSRANQAGVLITPKQLFENQTIAELSSVAGQKETIAEQGLVAGVMPLIPIQKWFFEQKLNRPHHWNQSVLLNFIDRPDPSQVHAAVCELLRHHDNLRVIFNLIGEERQAVIRNEVADQSFEYEDWSGISDSLIDERLKEATNQAQQRLDYENGPVMKLYYFDLGERRDSKLYWVIHHLAVDGVSWRILMEDFQTLLSQSQKGQTLQLPKKTTSYLEWAKQVSDYAGRMTLSEEQAYWLREDWKEVPNLPVDFPGGDNTERSVCHVTLSLSSDETRQLIKKTPAVYRTHTNDLLLAALARTIREWTGFNRVAVQMEGHGREFIHDQLDVSRTVGWFTTLYPVLLNSDPSLTDGELIKSIKEDLRSIPLNGFGYGLLRYMRTEGESLRQLPSPGIIFNHLGQIDGAIEQNPMYQTAKEQTASNTNADEVRPYPLEISMLVAGGQLHVTWSYSGGIYKRSTIDRLALEYMDHLHGLIAHCLSEEAGGYTPSDFPLATVNQFQLDRIHAQDRYVDELYPLTPMQQGMVYHSLYDKYKGDYVVQFDWAFKGGLNIQAFEEAWRMVVERFDTFRSYVLADGLVQIHQAIRKQVEVHIRLKDLRGKTSEEREAAIESYRRDDRAEGFDLSEPPLMRWALFQTNEEDFHFVWSHHHILLDGWSLPIVMKDLFTFYESAIRNQEIAIATSPPFSNYIRWLKNQDRRAAEIFWRAELEGFRYPTPIRIKSGIPSSERGHLYEERRLFITKDMTERLNEFVRNNQLTMNTLLQGAWALLLSRYSDEDDVLFGATVSGRPADLADVEQMVGPFINTLPVRVCLTNQFTVLDWLKQLQTKQNNLRQFEYCSILDIQGWSEVPRGVPLFESLFVFENYPVDPTAIEKMENNKEMIIESFQGKEQTGYPLSFVAAPGSQLSLGLMYDAGIYDSKMAEGILQHYVKGLEEVLDRPQGLLSEIDILPEAEREKLDQWNGTEIPIPDLSIYEMFERQAEFYPNSIALVHGEEEMSYGELKRRSTILAGMLLAEGARMEDLIGISMNRSIDAIVSILGVLKAGCAYVPIDPTYPKHRIGYILQDTKLGIILTQKHLSESFTDQGLCVICTDEIEYELDDSCYAISWKKANPDQLAYVIYTSGSTGLPKGVKIEHRGVVNMALAQIERFGVTAESRVLQFASMNFDASVSEMVMALFSGARLYLADQETLSSPKMLLDLLRQQAITTITLPSAYLFHLEPSDLPSLQTLIVAGDVCQAELVTLWGQDRAFFNAYGPTEASVCATIYRCSDARDPLPIGIPIWNTKLFVLDKWGRRTPIGVPGELFISGPGLARGYLNLEEATDDKFLPSPFKDGGRLYRTGDQVCYLDDGNMVFLGRMDSQVKIRGFRVELNEVEDMIRLIPGIEEATVIVTDYGNADKRIIAFYTSQAKVNLSPDELRIQLQNRLPHYMIPSLYLRLDQMPLNESGKIDKKSLAQTEMEEWNDTVPYQEPQTPLEKDMAEIWSEILKVGPIGLRSQFFDLGGHSLHALSVISQVREKYSLDVPIKSLFDYPVLEEWANYLESVLENGLSQRLPSIMKAEGHEEAPLSFSQQRMWFIDQLLPASSLYNAPLGLVLEGELDIGALQRSIDGLIKRHESLRTVFVNKSGHPLQRVTEPFSLPIRSVNLNIAGNGETDQEWERTCVELCSTPFNLSEGPLIRAGLCRITEDRHVLLLIMHHIVSDGWSVGVLIRDLLVMYRANSSRGNLELPELPIQYADYAIWQRKWLEKDLLKNQLKYWLEQLHDAAPMLQLPTDRPRPVVQSNRGDIVTSLVPERVTQKLKELCHTEGTTLYMTLLTVFNVLLYRYTGQEDILIGSPVAGRKDSKLENLIGLFVNTLVLRTNVSGDSTFRELLSRVKKVTLDAFTHQDLPFEKIVDDLQLERSLQYSPLFQVMFVLQNTELSMNEEVPGLQVYPMDVDLPDSKGAKYDLTLTMTESSQGIHASLEFNIDLFDRSTAERMLEHLLMIAHSAVEDPEKRIADMNLLSDHERELIEQWNETNWRDFEEAECVHRLFERQAYIQPDSIALLFGEEHLTYSQLNDKANRIAQLLSSLGAGPESLVGLCMDRSPDMVAGLLGIMKSGAAYVPLDPKYPTERLRYMMEDSNISLILTDRNAELKLNLDGLTILPMDDVNSHDANQCGNLSVPVTPSNLAYIIYTSGSTGKPKGVAIEHKSVFGLIQWAKETYQQDIFKGSLFSTSICFDLSVFELFVPLCVGGRVILEENILSLLESPVAGEVTIINTVPSATIELLRVNAIPPSVNVVNLAGEALPVTLVEQLYATGTVQKVFNLYGPTEDTTYSTYELVERGCVPTIGKSLPNSTTYILDSNLHRVPIGVPGELYLGGDGLARCYWNKEELTAERFIRNRFSNGRDDRLYRTGDIARYLQDGSIQYLGRLDNQVKVRGFRVELGEVEEVLRAYPSVRNAAAIVREGEQGNKQIVAYLETEPDLDTDTLLIRSYSQEKLPNYMIPAVFIVMDRLPLTPNGKINRKMLPLSIGVTEGNTVAYVPPRSEREKSLADVWSRVLRIQLIGMNDNFFGLGGDSLLVIQVVAKAFESGIQITPKQMFEHQTISELAKVSVLLSESNETEVILTGEMPLTPIQHWFFEQQHEDFHHWNQSIMLEIKTSVNQKLLEKCIQHLLLQHDILRVRFEQRDGEWIQYYAEEHPQAVLEVIDVSALASEEQQQAIEKRSDKVQRSLDITAGPIMRFVYFDLGEKNGRLLIIAHHLVVDVVSWRLIIEDIMRTYAKLSNHEEIRILPKSTSYQEWTTLLSRLAREDQTLREMEFWMNQLRGGFSLPKQFDNGSNTQADVAHVSATLSEEDTSKLFKLPQMMDTHINDWLLTALMLTIREWTGNEEITVHFEGHGRNEELGQRINLTRTVGWFTSMYPLKLRLGEADNYLEVVLHVSGLLKSVPNSGINYGLLRYLSEEQIRARFEIEAHPQICFNYFGQVDQLIEENSLFGFARESVGQTVSEKAVRTHLLDISCLVSNGRLTMNWLFSRNHYGKEFVEGIALRYMHYLQSVLQYGHLKTLEKDQIIL
ncbi:non-ribosomal peptide synthetase [Paenibacillus sp. JCM 10914]|uniref:non-ribosomal peptide synthetase n=1 Tax=Paenibacillus sp. JCM 10914 TaxID=1236974 RepID=UPI000690CC28|nr:non-ribosomal peptide synthetase [Paenibacillus sp. JCM 10914]